VSELSEVTTTVETGLDSLETSGESGDSGVWTLETGVTRLCAVSRVTDEGLTLKGLNPKVPVILFLQSSCERIG
jgi:hypothetical protein